ncbi:MAG: hypothetical protein RLZZ373_2634 [Pseudomonadota bacterium]|jgi:hypothetical protein
MTPHSHAARLFKLISAAGPAGALADDLCLRMGLERKQLTRAIAHLNRRGLVKRLSPHPLRYGVATAVAPTFGRNAVVRNPCQKPPRPEPAPFTGQATVCPGFDGMTARWQRAPSEPPIGFAKLPLGATLDGHGV